jgi:hypothetical protein
MDLAKKSCFSNTKVGLDEKTNSKIKKLSKNHDEKFQN